MKARNKKQTLLKPESSIFIATFSRYEKGRRMPTNGMVEPLLSFFLPKVRKLVLVDQPHPVSDSIHPVVEIYKKNKRDRIFLISSWMYYPIYFFCKMPSDAKIRLSYKLRDIVSVWIVALMERGERFNYFIGLEAINVIAGLILKKFGKVENVIYYVSDYSPNRFGKSLFNILYLWLDRFCIKYADFTWDVSPAMLEARLKLGLDPQLSRKVIHVPNALFPSQIISLPISKRAPNSLVYMGILDPDQGSDLAIESLQHIIKKISDVKLHIVGGSIKDVERLKELVERLKLDKQVIFYGFVPDNNEMAKIVRGCMIGLAPYRSFPDSFRWYGDAGKIRQYVASGLPVVTTQVPPLGRYMVKLGAALETNDTPEEFAQGIVTLLTNHDLYRKMSEKAQELSRENTWENTYNNAYRQMRNTV